MTEISARAFSWFCQSCNVGWPGHHMALSSAGSLLPQGIATQRLVCPHCGDLCFAEVEQAPGAPITVQRHVEWRAPVCSVPWNACGGCGRPWEWLDLADDVDARWCPHCGITHVGGRADNCADAATTVVRVSSDGDVRTFCTCHAAIALRVIPSAATWVDLTMYLPAQVPA